MIDHLIRFDSEADAIADPVVGQYWSEEGGWRGDCCFPGQQVWRPQDNTPGEDGNSVTHPLPYWYITICLSDVSGELRNHLTCMMVWDLATNSHVQSAIPIETFSEFRLSPVPAGRHYFFL